MCITVLFCVWLVLVPTTPAAGLITLAHLYYWRTNSLTVVQAGSFVVVMSQLTLWVRAVTEAPTA